VGGEGDGEGREEGVVKTLEDFPKFVVAAVLPGAVADDGYQAFEIQGTFDPILESTFDKIIEEKIPQWFWLLFDERGCITPMLKSFDRNTRTAILIFHETPQFKLDGLALPYLSPYWQAYHIWMVLDPTWGWERKKLQGLDAIAEDYEAEEVSLVSGREVKIWTKLEPKGIDNGQSRHYPAEDQTFPVHSGVRIIPGGWGHGHCELCNEHIDAGTIGYCDRDNRWMCENCYERYVVPHDLAFVDEL
jgi:hypothetical protein